MSSDETKTDLEKLAALREKNILTDSEYETQKQAILNKNVVQKKPVRTQKNAAEKIFSYILWGVLGTGAFLVFMSAMNDSSAMWVANRKLFFIITGFFIPVMFILWIVALALRPFFIRARYFAYYFLLIFTVALLGLIFDYMFFTAALPPAIN